MHRDMGQRMDDGAGVHMPKQHEWSPWLQCLERKHHQYGINGYDYTVHGSRQAWLPLRGVSIVTDYGALKEQWTKLEGKTIAEKLALLNAMTVPAPPPAPEPDPTVMSWSQANGWGGPINENDLVVAGLISDDDRKAAEKGAM